MSRYLHRRGDGKLCRRVMIGFLIAEDEEQFLRELARKEEARNIHDLLHGAMCEGIDDMEARHAEAVTFEEM